MQKKKILVSSPIKKLPSSTSGELLQIANTILRDSSIQETIFLTYGQVGRKIFVIFVVIHFDLANAKKCTKFHCIALK